MKKILLAIAAAWVLMCPAQNNIPSATLQHGASRTVFYGNSAFAAAYQAAADTLDVIYLSSGTFTNPGEIKKSITVYGVGFEADPATNIEPTRVQDAFYINPAEGAKVNGIHLEGIYFYSDFQVKAAVVDEQQQHVHHLTIVKCTFNNLTLSAATHDTNVRQCYIRGSVGGGGNNGNPAQNLILQNCFIQGWCCINLPTTAEKLSSAVIDHCILTAAEEYNDRRHGAFTYTNSIIRHSRYGFVASGATVNGCVYVSSSLPGGVMGNNNYFITNLSSIFTDANNWNYAAERTFAVSEELVGLDDTPCGVAGGLGWHKFTSLPRVTEMNSVLSDDAKTLQVTIKADVPE